MKNISLVTNIILLTIIVYYGCSKSDVKKQTVPCASCKEYPNAAFKGISVGTAVQMANDYQQINLPKLKIGKEDDAACIWFSVETMKAFIYKIEKETCSDKCPPSTLGIRIYYAKYPKNMNTPDLHILPDSFSLHHTLFMVPTFKNAKSDTNYDFDPWNIGPDVCNPQPLKIDSPYNSKPILAFLMGNETWDEETAKNHGDLIPPNKPCPGCAFYRQ